MIVVHEFAPCVDPFEQEIAAITEATRRNDRALMFSLATRAEIHEMLRVKANWELTVLVVYDAPNGKYMMRVQSKELLDDKGNPAQSMKRVNVFRIALGAPPTLSALLTKGADSLSKLSASLKDMSQQAQGIVRLEEPQPLSERLTE